MKRHANFLFTVMISMIALMIIGCSSEPPQTEKLYTDARAMWDEINKAFTLPGRSQERVTAMNKLISEKTDIQLVSKLEQYLKDAPNGKYAKEAGALLDSARSSRQVQGLAQVRPFLEKTGAPKTAAEADSVANQIRREHTDSAK